MHKSRHNPLKKEIAIGTSLQFAGYIISRDSVRPERDRVEALRKFLALTNVTGVHSFQGLAHQLTFFIPDFSHATAALKQILGKNKLFRRLPEHQQEFNEVKNILSNNLLTKYFDPKKEVTLLTDATHQHGMGFALCQ